MTSPPRSAANKPLAVKSAGMTSPSAARKNTSQIGEDDDKTAEEKAEEKKKIDMMRKFYRNRHSSFLQALGE